MRTGFALAAATLLTFGAGGPAFADNDWSDRKRWQKHEGSEAYRQGYRDGLRADKRRDRWRETRGSNDWGRYDDRVWVSDNRYADRGYWQDSHSSRYPVYRDTSWNGSSRYRWGPNGQLQCRRQDGTTGLVVGAIAGGTLGNVIAREGDKRLGSVIGGTLGAVLGNEIAKGNARCR
jgi:hypothetical protein